MNWDAIGAVGEVFGATAVVISLLYLAAQVRTQNRESRLAATHEILAGYRELGMAFQNPETARVFAKANADFESLTDQETIQLLGIVLPTLRLWEEAFYQNLDGRLDDRMWVNFTKVFEDTFGSSAFKKAWKLRENGFSDQFRKYVNAVDSKGWKIR
ncbi:MAG: hypothetical protein ACI915_004382 [Gammaproteobacteria bacterium]|jgi:hypothetical protein